MSVESDLYKQLFKKNAIGEYLQEIKGHNNDRQNRKDREMVEEREIIENSRIEKVGKSESWAVENEKNVKLERMKERERDQLGESVETVVNRSKFEEVKIDEEIQRSLAKTIEEMDEIKVQRTPRHIFTVAQSMNIDYYNKVTVGDHVSGESSISYDSESEMPLYESKPLPPQSHAKSASTPHTENKISISDKYPELINRIPIEESITLPLNPPPQKSNSSLDLPASDHTSPAHATYHSVPLPFSPTLYQLPCNHSYELSYLQSYLSLITLTCSPNNSIKCPSPDCFEYIDKSSLLAILLNHSPFTIEVCPSSTCCGYSISPKNSSIFQCGDCKEIHSIKFHT
jgi:hypothetical protein